MSPVGKKDPAAAAKAPGTPGTARLPPSPARPPWPWPPTARSPSCPPPPLCPHRRPSRTPTTWKGTFPEEPDFRDREFLITECLPLVKFVAHRISARLPAHVEVDDLIHSGILGLMDAVKKFEPGRNVKFKTYAEQRIRGAILDGLRDLDWVPRSLRRKKKDIENAYHLLEQQFGPGRHRRGSGRLPGPAPWRSSTSPWTT